MAAGGEGQESRTSEISNTWDMIWNGYGVVPDAPDGIGMPLRDLGDMSGPQMSSSPSQPPVDELAEFFDFSDFSDGGTLDLVSLSSTDPSPVPFASSVSHIGAVLFPPLPLGTSNLKEEVDGMECVSNELSEWWQGRYPYTY
jgi:hypothetical protein